MSETIRVQVVVDTDQLRLWAGKHADAGHAGVAHVLYEAANRYETQTVASAAELDALPVGTVVRTNWAVPGPQYVCERLPDGWFTLLHSVEVFPLGTGINGQTVTVIYRPEPS
jgi:hypothetical protein